MKPILLATALFFLFSCSDPKWNSEYDWDVNSIPDVKKAENTSVYSAGSYGGTWRGTYAEDPKSFNPFSNLDGSHTVVTELILDYLFDYNTETKEWSGNIVRDFTVITDTENDRMELKCRLRDDIYWSDGVRMTADDVVWYFNNIENNKEIYPLGEQGLYITMPDGSREKYTIELNGEFEFTYRFPRIVSEPMLVVNTGNIVPRHIWEPVIKEGKKSAEAFWGVNTPPEKLVGNGPFLLERIIPGERIIFRRNPSYWKKDEKGQRLPYIDRIILSYTPDPNSELLRFQKGETDAYNLRGQDLYTLLPESRKGRYSVWNGGAAGFYTALLFNHNKTTLPEHKYRLFTDRKFKAAVSCLIDRHTIINQTANGLAEPQLSAFDATNRYYDSAASTRFTYDPQRAEKLLAECSLADRDSDGILEDKDGNDVEFSILTGSSDPVTLDYLNIIISDFEKVGIKATIQSVDFNVIVQKLLHTYDWDCYLAGMSLPLFPEQWYNIWLSAGNLHYWYPNQKSPSQQWEKRLDKLYESLIYTYDRDEIMKNYSLFQHTVMDELIIIPIFRRYLFMAADNKWENLNWNNHSSIGDGFRRIYLKKGQEE